MGTGTKNVGVGDLGLREVGHGDVRIGGREDSIEDAGTRGRGSRVREDSETLGLVNVGRENVETRGLGYIGTQRSDKPITPGARSI